MWLPRCHQEPFYLTYIIKLTINLNSRWHKFHQNKYFSKSIQHFLWWEISERLHTKVVTGGKNNEAGKHPTIDEENLPLRFQEKYFWKAVSNKEPALRRGILQWVKELGHAPRQRTTQRVLPPLPFLKQFPQILLNISTFPKHWDFPKIGAQPDQPSPMPNSCFIVEREWPRGWYWGSQTSPVLQDVGARVSPHSNRGCLAVPGKQPSCF